MDGAHDLGGMQGFGPVDRSQEEFFPEQWERKVFALTLACGMQGKWNLDQSRFARESMDPAHYLSSSYYEHWLHGLETLLVEQGVVSPQELATGQADQVSEYEPVTAERVAGILSSGGPTSLSDESPARYAVGDEVQIKSTGSVLHTRLPRYIRGHVGEIVLYHGSHIFPDQHSKTADKVPAHLYTVEFSAVTLWGEEYENTDAVLVDVFEPYIVSKV